MQFSGSVVSYGIQAKCRDCHKPEFYERIADYQKRRVNCEMVQYLDQLSSRNFS